MAKLTSAERLSADIDQILKEYQMGVLDGLDTALKKLAQKGRNAVQRNARAVIAKKRRRYSNGWAYKVEKSSNLWAANAVIYQKSVPGLVHLLEHGHAKVNGGRTRALVHVEPVEEELADAALGALRAEIKKT